MNIDLSKCVKGQKLKLRNGIAGEYIGSTHCDNNLYLANLKGDLGYCDHYYMQNGCFLNYNLSDYDIIEIIPMQKQYTEQEKMSVMNAYIKGKEIECNARCGSYKHWVTQTHVPNEGFDWNMFNYRIKETSPIAKGYNPKQLTEEQVGVKDGWRLLELDEYNLKTNSTEIQMFDLFWCSATIGYQCSNTNLCYRTKKPAGYFLKKKEKPYTLETIPKCHTLIRYNGSNIFHVITGYGPYAIKFLESIYNGPTYIRYDDLALPDCKYMLSFDNGKTWETPTDKS